MLFKHSEIRSWSYMTAKFFNMVLYTETIYKISPIDKNQVSQQEGFELSL